MKKKLLLVVVLCLFFGLALVAVTSAQGPEEGGGASVGAQDEVAALNVVNTFGDNVLYMFSGVVNNSSPALATSVHCTNHYTAAVDIQVEFFESDGTGYALATQSLAENETKTISTQNTVYAEILPSFTLPEINQGAGVVRVTNPTGVEDVICTVQVIGIGASPESDPPTLMAKLHLFDKYGNLVNPPTRTSPPSSCGPCSIYLPTVLKNAN